MILLVSKIFWYQDVSETHKGSPTKIFCAVRSRNFVRKSLYTPLMLNFCQYPEIGETLKCCPTQYFCTVRQKKLTKWLYSKKKQKSSWNRRFPLWTFLVLWDKNISTENHGTPNIHKIFDIRTVLKHIRVPLPIFGTARQNSFNIKILIYPSFVYFFSIPGICETLNCSPAKRFGTVRQKIKEKKLWYSPPSLNLSDPKVFSRIESFLFTEGFPYE